MACVVPDARHLFTNVPKMNTGRNVETSAKKNATKTVTVLKHANRDANVTRVSSDRKVFVCRDALQHTVVE